jgi:hypothetical protein
MNIGAQSVVVVSTDGHCINCLTKVLLPIQFLLKLIAVQIAPFLTKLFDRSLIAGHFPDICKSAFITPLIKKAGMDVSDCRSYRPISNLSVVSKLPERLVARQLMDYLRSTDLLSSCQSAYRPFHSIETAVLRMLSDILKAVDSGDMAGLVLILCWIFPPLLTLSVTKFCYVALIHHMASTVQQFNGFAPI